MYERQGQDIFFQFSQDHPNFARRTVDWRLQRRDELLVILDDGTELKYDAVYNAIAGVSHDELTEDICKHRFSRTMKRYMILIGVTQDELSQLSGISRVTIGKYVRGEALPGTYNLHRLSKAFDCSISELAFFD